MTAPPRRRHGRLRLHGRRPLPGLAHRPPVLRPAAAARTWRCSAGRDATRRRRGRRPARLGGTSRPTGAALLEPRRHRPGRHLHARRHPRRDRHRRARRPASTCCARSRWPTPSRRRGRWPPPRSAAAGRGVPVDGRLQLPAGAGGRRWPGSWSPRGGSARSGTCARSTCRTGSSTRSPRWSGGCRRTRPGPARSATSARTSSTSPSSSPVQLLTGVSALTETFVKERPLPAARRLAGCRRPAGTGTRHRSPSTTPRCSSAASPAARWPPSRPPGSPPGRKNAHAASRSTARAARWPSTSSDMNDLQFYDGDDDPATPPGFRRILVTEPTTPTSAAWWPPGHGLGYEHTLHPPGRATWSPPSAEGARPGAVLRRRPAGAAGAGRRRAQSPRDGQRRLDHGDRVRRPVDAGRTADGPTDHAVHRPVGRPAVRGGVPAGLAAGATTAWRSPAGATTSTSWRGRRRRLLRRGAPRRCSSKYGLKVFAISNHLNGPGRLRRPDRRAAPRHPARPGLGRRRPRGRAAAGRRGDEGHRPGRRAARRRHRRRLHRLEDLEDRGDVPAGARVDGRARLPRLRRPVEPDPRRVRRGRACGSPTRCTPARSPTTTGRPCARWRRSGTGRRSG